MSPARRTVPCVQLVPGVVKTGICQWGPISLASTRPRAAGGAHFTQWRETFLYNYTWV